MKDTKLLELLINKKVLYAEDEHNMQSNVAEILELFFNEVIVANDGEEALIAYETHHPDVLILDICMPKIDGLEVVKEIRKKDKKIPIILLSAHTEQNYLWRAVELRICKYLKKPFNKNLLLQALEACSMELAGWTVDIHIGEGTYSHCNKKFLLNGQDIQLSKNESNLLEYFIQRASQTITFDDIDEYMWGYEGSNKEAIKSLVKELRRKIGKETVKNVYGIGYILEL